MRLPRPAAENDFLAGHIGLLRRSFRHWTGRDLVNRRMTDAEAARYVFDASFALLSHDTSPDPIFNYANRTAMSLFGMEWEELTRLPSRLSAEPRDQKERETALQEVVSHGYIDHYSGVRIGRHGNRFKIENALVWNLRSPQGILLGQAARFDHWTFLHSD
ncbi:MAG: MEKHLA domain-containing protein [Methylococcaceae bacterium]|nr:MEKHLA domain-containing protein [Methylococcaceae bacterium]